MILLAYSSLFCLAVATVCAYLEHEGLASSSDRPLIFYALAALLGDFYIVFLTF